MSYWRVIIPFVERWIIMDSNDRENRRKDQLYWLGVNVTFYRKLKRMSRDELAARSGLSSSVIACIEAANVTKDHKTKTILDVADGLGISPHLLFDFEKGDTYGKKTER